MPVKCTFILNRKQTSTLTCDGTPPVEAFSGTGHGRDDPDDTAIKDVGPLPKGIYYLVDRQSGGFLGPIRDWVGEHTLSTNKNSWFTLWNPVSGDITNIDGIKRGNFRLHPMGQRRLSEGCITVVQPYAFDQLQKFIRSQGLTLPVPNTALRAYGTVEVR